MTELVPAAPAAAAPAYIAPPEPDGDVAAAVLLDDLMIDCGSQMPKPVLAVVRPLPGAGSQLPRIEAAVEGLYDWSCNGSDCPDEARRACAACAYVMNRFGFHALGASVNGGPSRAALIVAELKRQLGDPQSTASATDRPTPMGTAVPNPVEATTAVKLSDIVTLLADLKEVRSELPAGADTSKLDAAIAAAEAKLTPADPAGA